MLTSTANDRAPQGGEAGRYKARTSRQTHRGESASGHGHSGCDRRSHGNAEQLLGQDVRDSPAGHAAAQNAAAHNRQVKHGSAADLQVLGACDPVILGTERLIDEQVTGVEHRHGTSEEPPQASRSIWALKRQSTAKAPPKHRRRLAIAPARPRGVRQSWERCHNRAFVRRTTMRSRIDRRRVQGYCGLMDLPTGRRTISRWAQRGLIPSPTIMHVGRRQWSAFPHRETLGALCRIARLALDDIPLVEQAAELSRLSKDQRLELWAKEPLPTVVLLHCAGDSDSGPVH